MLRLGSDARPARAPRAVFGVSSGIGARMTPRRPSCAARSLIAGVLIVVGLVWIGQGLGIIRGASVMTDDVTWAVIGAVLVVAGVVVAATVVRSRPQA